MDLATVVLYTVVQCSGGLGLEYKVFAVPNCVEFEADHGGRFATFESHSYAMCLPAPSRFVSPKPVLNRYEDYSWGTKCSKRNAGD